MTTIMAVLCVLNAVLSLANVYMLRSWMSIEKRYDERAREKMAWSNVGDYD